VPVHNKIYVSWQTFGKYKLSWLLSNCYMKIHWSILVNIKHDKIKIAHHQSLIIGYLLSVFEFCRSQTRLLQCRRSKICCFTSDKHLGWFNDNHYLAHRVRNAPQFQCATFNYRCRCGIQASNLERSSNVWCKRHRCLSRAWGIGHKVQHWRYQITRMDLHQYQLCVQPWCRLQLKRQP